MAAVEIESTIIPDRAQWSHAWSSGEAPAPTCHRQLIESVIASMSLAGKRVLEVGAGTGRDSVELASLGAEAYALDFTQEALVITRTLSEQHRTELRLVRGDTMSLPFADASFDLVFSQGLLEHFSDPAQVAREQARLLRRGGLLLVDVPQKYSLYTLHKRRLMRRSAWFAGWETEFSLGELTALLRAAGLRPVRSYGEGYFPSLLLGLRNLHTLDERYRLPLRLPARLRARVERAWQAAEAAPWFHRWMTNIGVLAEKV